MLGNISRPDLIGNQNLPLYSLVTGRSKSYGLY